MKSSTLFKTNLLVCIIIILGFTTVSIVSYRSNFEMYQKDVEMVSTLSSDGLYSEITGIFSQPVSVSLTMANDSLLKNFLRDEQRNLINADWQERMREYLNAYREKYGYDSVFLVSSFTRNYYHFQGLDRVLTPDNPENDWYYSFAQGKDEYSLNVDNDEATDNSITAFVNCKIKDTDGTVLGVVGVGLKVRSLQELLSRYEQEYGVRVYMVDHDGVIQISSSVTGYEKTNLFDTTDFLEDRKVVLENTTTQKSFWYSSGSNSKYVVSQYEPNLKWHLIVENDTTAASRQFSIQLYRNILVILFIIIMVIIIITTVIRRYNIRISELTLSQELEYQRLLHEMTESLYDNIYELDITHNRAGSEDTRAYFESLGIRPDAPYDKALHQLAQNQIKPEYVQGYLDTFSPTAVMAAFQSGITNLSYDFMISDDGTNYHWIRIAARIFYWDSDQSVRMITYRKNIDAEKRHELQLLEDVQRDSMTGLYNKRATEDLIGQVLGTSLPASKRHALLIFDIDNFKAVNDRMGHSFGDHVINEMASTIQTQFREDDIVGRIGGDEFAVFMKNFGSEDALRQKLTRLCSRITGKDFGKDGQSYHIDCSIGVALYPQHGSVYSELFEKADQALYYTKSHGKSSFNLFDEHTDSHSFHATPRDMGALLGAAADGLAQYACTNPLTLLYFDPKCVDLFGIPAEVLSQPGFNAMDFVHPDDAERVRCRLKAALAERRPFASTFRIRHHDNYYLHVRTKGVFVEELYQNRYPVFYVMYFKEEGDV